VPAAQAEEGTQEPPAAPESSGGLVPVEGTGPTPDCTLPSFALIEVHSALPWACVAAACPQAAADCADDCLCNDVFTRALQCLNLSLSPACFTSALANGQDPAVTAFAQCIISHQGSCSVGVGADAGSEAEASAADASEEAGIPGSPSDATFDVAASDAAAD
jgi:hypothetical protein